MPLNIHPDCKRRLKEVLAKHLDTINIKNNFFLDRQSTDGLFEVSDILLKHGPIVERLESYIGELPLYEFLCSYLSKELTEEQEYNSSISVSKLTDIEKYSNVVETAERLIETFDSLPWKYVFTLKFKQFLSPIFEEASNRYQLSDTISLTKPDAQLNNEYPLQLGIKASDNELGLIRGFLARESDEWWDKDFVYLQFVFEGFVGKYLSTQTNVNFVSMLKSFCGLSIALRLIKVEYSYRLELPKTYFYVHRYIDGKWIKEETEELSEDLSRTINDLVFHDLEGKINDIINKKIWMIKCLSKLKRVFSNIEQSERLLLAGQWFFDSYTGRNDLLSFVQVMVAVEILLGDKATSDVVGINELLRNRCAYLIGKDYKQREQILDDFKAIYEIRSKIVHRGKSKLNLKERYLFNKLQWLCRRVIQKEIELIAENKDG
ncbi:MAG: HEPN domain-containing protein [Candidatus Scalindua sp.]|nr:HEPN domain-containing protein [Candidatus Scalindua sp.]